MWLTGFVPERLIIITGVYLVGTGWQIIWLIDFVTSSHIVG